MGYLAIAQRREVAGVTVATRTCEECGGSLEGKSSRARFCKSICKERNWRRRRNPETVELYRQRNAEYMRGYYTRNRDEIRAYYATWFAANEGWVRRDRWRANQRRRGAPVDLTGLAYYDVLIHDPCSYCGAPPPSIVDHIVPLSAGGTSSWDNLTAACGPCNAAKGNKSLLLFLATR